MCAAVVRGRTSTPISRGCQARHHEQLVVDFVVHGGWTVARWSSFVLAPDGGGACCHRSTRTKGDYRGITREPPVRHRGRFQGGCQATRCGTRSAQTETDARYSSGPVSAARTLGLELRTLLPCASPSSVAPEPCPPPWTTERTSAGADDRDGRAHAPPRIR